MYRLERLTASTWTLAITLCGSLAPVAGCSSDSGTTEAPQATPPADGVRRTANGQVILEPGTAGQAVSPPSGTQSPGAGPAPTGSAGAQAEVMGGADIALEPPADAGSNPSDPPAAPTAEEEAPDDEDEDEDEDD